MSWTEIILLALVIWLFFLLHRLQSRLIALAVVNDNQFNFLRQRIGEIADEIAEKVEERERDTNRLRYDVRDLERAVKVMRCRHDWDEEVCQKCGLTIDDFADLYK